MTTVHICHSITQLVDELADSLVSELRGALDEGRDLIVALSGGSTPRPFYEHLASLDPGTVPWHHMRVFMVDERDVPLDDPASSLGMIKRLWLDPIELPADRIHVPPVAYGDLEGAARDYEQQLRQYAGDPARIDWMLLGLGPDGHIASLFPRHPALEVDDRDVIAVTNSPKPPPRRLTLALPAIRRAAEIQMMVTGESKSEAVRLALDGEIDVRRFPSHVLKEAEGRVCWWLDGAADGRDGGGPGDD